MTDREVRDLLEPLIRRALVDGRLTNQNATELSRWWDQREARISQLRQALVSAREACSLDIRRVAFTPPIGVRYSEDIRLKISAECHRLEERIDRALADPQWQHDATP